MRRVAARSTEHIALHFGAHFPMYIGCGYPKSGTVWLCQLMGHYLGVPYPQNYVMPIAMSSVVHAHWRYDVRLPSTAYIRRDGRDVMVSLYFYEMRAAAQTRHPRAAAMRQSRFARLFGAGFDPADIRTHLPRFIEDEMSNPRGLRGTTWQQHVAEWCGQPHRNVTHVTYEHLLDDPLATFSTLMTGVTGERADEDRVSLAVQRFDFSRTGREAGSEDRSSFMRKGIHGDWRNHFTRDAGEVFHRYAGEALRSLGYEDDPGWFEKL